MNGFINVLAGFGLNLAAVLIIVRFIYYPQRRDKDYVFTFIAFNTVIYFVMGLLNDTGLSVGVGFGLFAIFSVLRYRTSTIPIREMTYLFVLIALPVINSILFAQGNIGEFAAVNLATIGLLYVLEAGWGFTYEARKIVTYERVDVIRPEHWPQLLEDLRQRLGLPIKRIEIGRVNFLRDTAEIVVYYDAQALSSAPVSLAANSHHTDLNDTDED